MSSAAKLSLDELIHAAERELGLRERVYPGLVANGRMTPAAAAHELQAQRQIVDILVLFRRFEGPFRELALRRLADIRAIERHPAVEAVMEVFPDAQLFVRDLPTASQPPEHADP